MRAQYLLESYYGERLLQGATAQYETQSFNADVLNERNYIQASPQHLERSFQSDELSARNFCNGRMGGDILQMIDNHGRNVELDVRQMQAIRALGENLKRVADGMQIRPENHALAVEQAFMQEEGLSDEEMQVVRRIYAERTSTTISKIAGHLRTCLTSRTFRMTLGYLCSNTSSVPEELAAACELVRFIYPRVQEAIQAGPIYDELKIFIENKLDEVLH